MATTSSSFRTTQWDPVLILSQIVCLQALWYISISTIVFTLFKFSGIDINLDAILNYREIRGDSSQGLLLGFAWLLNSVVGVYLLLKIVARARLVLDFSLTLLIYHIIMTTLYSDHIPTSFLWWSLNGTTAGIMVFVGEYVCMQQEMEPILLGGNNSGSSDNRNSSRGDNRNDSRVDSIGINKNSGSNSNNNDNSDESSMSLQGAAVLSGMHHDDRYGYDESAGLLMETFDAKSNNINNAEPSSSSSSSSASMSTSNLLSSARVTPQKSRSGGETGVVRGGFAPGARSSIIGDKGRGRQRTSDGYKSVPASETDSR